MKNNFFLVKYFSIAILFILIINILGFIAPFSEQLNQILSNFKAFTYLPYAFGLVIVLMAIFEFRKFEINIFLFIGILLVTLLNYYVGSLFLIIWVLMKQNSQ